MARRSGAAHIFRRHRNTAASHLPTYCAKSRASFAMNLTRSHRTGIRLLRSSPNERVRIAVLTGDDNCRSKADTLFTALLTSAAENVFGHLSLLNALDLHLSGAEILVVGEGARADALLATARKLPHGTSIVLHAPSADVLSATHPARAKLYATTDGAAFVCRGQSCSLPVTESDVLVQMVASQYPQARE